MRPAPEAVVERHELTAADLAALRLCLGRRFSPLAMENMLVAHETGAVRGWPVSLELDHDPPRWLEFRVDEREPFVDVHCRVIRPHLTSAPAGVQIESWPDGTLKLAYAPASLSHGLGQVRAVEVVSVDERWDVYGPGEEPWRVIRRERLVFDQALRFRFAGERCLTLSTSREPVGFAIVISGAERFPGWPDEDDDVSVSVRAVLQ